MDKNLQAVCKTAMGHQNTALKSTTLVTDIYKYNRQILVKRHSKTVRHSLLEKMYWLMTQVLMKTVFINSVRAEICGTRSAIIQEPHIATEVLIQHVAETWRCSPPSAATTGRTAACRGKESRCSLYEIGRHRQQMHRAASRKTHIKWSHQAMFFFNNHLMPSSHYTTFKRLLCHSSDTWNDIPHVK